MTNDFFADCVTIQGFGDNARVRVAVPAGAEEHHLGVVHLLQVQNRITGRWGTWEHHLGRDNAVDAFNQVVGWRAARASESRSV